MTWVCIFEKKKQKRIEVYNLIIIKDGNVLTRLVLTQFLTILFTSLLINNG